MAMNAEDMLREVEQVRGEFQREEDQGLLQHDIHKAEMALAGKYACERITRRVCAVSGVAPISVRPSSRQK
jgi:hypothetical protein